MDWCIPAIAIILGVSAGLIRLAYLIGCANGDIDGFTRGYKRGQESDEHFRSRSP
jgi:hypothetical protein